MSMSPWQEHPNGSQLGCTTGTQPMDWDEFDLHDARIEAGECPNGHGLMAVDGPYDWHCDTCPFVYSQRFIAAGSW